MTELCKNCGGKGWFTDPDDGSIRNCLDCVPDSEDEEVPAKFDPVNNPRHYCEGDPAYEPIKVIEAWDLGFNLGNCVKYIARHRKKGSKLEDLQKACWYLTREIENLQKEDE